METQHITHDVSKNKGFREKGFHQEITNPRAPAPGLDTPEASGEVVGDASLNKNSEAKHSKKVEAGVGVNEEISLECEDSSQADTQVDDAPEEKRPKKSRGETCLLTPEQEVDLVNWYRENPCL